MGGKGDGVCISLVLTLWCEREGERERERKRQWRWGWRWMGWNRVGGVCNVTYQRFIPRVIRLYERGQRLLGAEDRAAEV